MDDNEITWMIENKCNQNEKESKGRTKLERVPGRAYRIGSSSLSGPLQLTWQHD